MIRRLGMVAGALLVVACAHDADRPTASQIVPTAAAAAATTSAPAASSTAAAAETPKTSLPQSLSILDWATAICGASQGFVDASTEFEIGGGQSSVVFEERKARTGEKVDALHIAARRAAGDLRAIFPPPEVKTYNDALVAQMDQLVDALTEFREGVESAVSVEEIDAAYRNLAVAVARSGPRVEAEATALPGVAVSAIGSVRRCGLIENGTATYDLRAVDLPVRLSVPAEWHQSVSAARRYADFTSPDNSVIFGVTGGVIQPDPMSAGALLTLLVEQSDGALVVVEDADFVPSPPFAASVMVRAEMSYQLEGDAPGRILSDWAVREGEWLRFNVARVGSGWVIAFVEAVNREALESSEELLQDVEIISH